MAKPKDKEEIILSSAIKIFKERGFANTSIKDIANASGLAKGTLYDYFTNKEDLFIKAIKYKIDALNDGKFLRISDNRNFLEQVEYVLEITLSSEAVEQFQWIGTVIFNDLTGLSTDAKEKIQAIFDETVKKGLDMWQDILRQGVRQKQINVKDLEFAASCIFSIIAAQHHYVVEKKGIDYKQIKGRVLEFILNGIGYKE